ncbi:hypothetical protein NNRS527_00963 [Nitrosospira sp. NRS527]|nr:hypothetical protein NNRS527_00963 [Nitrosospira sp. NRS527]
MFLLLVIDPNSCKTVAGNLSEQRFNVAASRARDRVYLVRSVTASQLSDTWRNPLPLTRGNFSILRNSLFSSFCLL